MSASSDVAFSPAVKAEQHRRGGVPAHQRIEARGGFRTDLTPDLIDVPGRRGHRLSRDRQRRRPALRPASRRPERLHPRAGRPHARLRRFHRQPAVHHDRKPGRERPRFPVPDGLRASAPDQAVGPRPHDGRPRPDRPADARGHQRPRRAGRAVHGRGVGQQLPPAHPTEARRGRCRRGGAPPGGAHRRSGSGERPAARGRGPRPA